jgi:hypothetical protein
MSEDGFHFFSEDTVHERPELTPEELPRKPKPKAKTQSKPKSRPIRNRKRPKQIPAVINISCLDLDAMEHSGQNATRPTHSATAPPSNLPPRNPIEQLHDCILSYLDIATRTVSSAFVSELKAQLDCIDGIDLIISRFISSLQTDLERVIDESNRWTNRNVTVIIGERELAELTMPTEFGSDSAVPQTDLTSLKLEIDTANTTTQESMLSLLSQLRNQPEAEELPQTGYVAVEHFHRSKISQLVLASQLEFLNSQMARLEHSRGTFKEVRQPEVDTSGCIQELVAELSERNANFNRISLKKFVENAIGRADEMNEFTFRLSVNINRLVRLIGRAECDRPRSVRRDRTNRSVLAACEAELQTLKAKRINAESNVSWRLNRKRP